MTDYAADPKSTKSLKLVHWLDFGLILDSAVFKADVTRATKIVRYCRTIFVVQRCFPTNHVTHT